MSAELTGEQRDDVMAQFKASDSHSDYNRRVVAVLMFQRHTRHQLWAGDEKL